MGKIEDYEPKPLDTTAIQLPEHLLKKRKQLARNNHDNWADKRKKQGWKYGPKRDDQKLETPCMVDFDDLPPEEQEYDYVTADEALKTVIALGCSIEDKNEHYFKLFDSLRERIKFLGKKKGPDWEKLAWRTFGEELVRIYYLLDRIPDFQE